MRIRARYLLILLVLLGIVAAAIFGVYHASQQVPEFYTQELAIPSASQEKDSDLMIRQITTLHNNFQEKGTWQHVFKAQTVNAWLAVDLPQNHPTLLPRGMRDPRVRIGPEGITLACMVERGGFHGVVTLQVSAFVESADVIGLQIHKARLGAIPWSIRTVLDRIADAAQKSNVDIRWRQSDGDPVALIRVTPLGERHKQVIHIDTLRLEEGALIVAGTTEIVK